MAEPTVWVFFYGSYMNRDVLSEANLVPGQFEVARLDGYDIRIAPLANLIPSSEHCVYGVLATATHSQLHRLYTEHARQVLGGTYEAEAVLANDRDGRWRPALCYLAHDLAEAPPDADYVRRIAQPARTLGFPDWYCSRIEGFASL